MGLITTQPPSSCHRSAYTAQIPHLFSESLRNNTVGLPEDRVDLLGACAWLRWNPTRGPHA